MLRLLTGLLFAGLLWGYLTRILGIYNVSVFIVLSAGLGIVFVLSPLIQLIGYPILLLVMIITKLFRKRIPYLNVVARIEGGGIKRGLIAPEAAVLLGKPFNIILSIIILGLLKKGILILKKSNPLVVKVASDYYPKDQMLNIEDRAELRRQAAQRNHLVVYPYEEMFIELFASDSNVVVHEIDYAILIKPLIKMVAERIAGYDLEETRNYYKLIIRRAPKEARVDGMLVSEKQIVFDRNLLWVLLDEDYQAVLNAEKNTYIPDWMQGNQGEADFGEMNSFAGWVSNIYESMEGCVPESIAEIKLGKEIDRVTASLLADISQATFYG